MQVYTDTISILNVCASLRGTELGLLIAQRVNELSEYEFADLSEIVKIIVLEEYDQQPKVDEELRFPFRSRDFDVAEKHNEWFELTAIIGDSGYGVLIYVPRHLNMDATLLDHCERQWIIKST